MLKRILPNYKKSLRQSLNKFDWYVKRSLTHKFESQLRELKLHWDSESRITGKELDKLFKETNITSPDLVTHVQNTENQDLLEDFKNAWDSFCATLSQYDACFKKLLVFIYDHRDFMSIVDKQDITRSILAEVIFKNFHSSTIDWKDVLLKNDDVRRHSLEYPGTTYALINKVLLHTRAELSDTVNHDEKQRLKVLDDYSKLVTELFSYYGYNEDDIELVPEFAERKLLLQHVQSLKDHALALGQTAQYLRLLYNPNIFFLAKGSEEEKAIFLDLYKTLFHVIQHDETALLEFLEKRELYYFCRLKNGGKDCIFDRIFDAYDRNNLEDILFCSALSENEYFDEFFPELKQHLQDFLINERNVEKKSKFSIIDLSLSGEHIQSLVENGLFDDFYTTWNGLVLGHKKEALQRKKLILMLSSIKFNENGLNVDDILYGQIKLFHERMEQAMAMDDHHDQIFNILDARIYIDKDLDQDIKDALGHIWQRSMDALLAVDTKNTKKLSESVESLGHKLFNPDHITDFPKYFSTHFRELEPLYNQAFGVLERSIEAGQTHMIEEFGNFLSKENICSAATHNSQYFSIYMRLLKLLMRHAKDNIGANMAFARFLSSDHPTQKIKQMYHFIRQNQLAQNGSLYVTQEGENTFPSSTQNLPTRQSVAHVDAATKEEVEETKTPITTILQSTFKDWGNNTKLRSIDGDEWLEGYWIYDTGEHYILDDPVSEFYENLETALKSDPETSIEFEEVRSFIYTTQDDQNHMIVKVNANIKNIGYEKIKVLSQQLPNVVEQTIMDKELRTESYLSGISNKIKNAIKGNMDVSVELDKTKGFQDVRYRIQLDDDFPGLSSLFANVLVNELPVEDSIFIPFDHADIDNNCVYLPALPFAENPSWRDRGYLEAVFKETAKEVLEVLRSEESKLPVSMDGDRLSAMSEEKIPFRKRFKLISLEDKDATKAEILKLAFIYREQNTGLRF